MSRNSQNMQANGPAIKGGCVTRRKHRAGSWYFSRETVTVQGEYGACFCNPGTSFLSITSVAEQGLSEPVNYHGTGFLLETLAQRSRYKLSRSQKAVKVQDYNCVLMRVSGCKSHYKFVLVQEQKQKP